MDKLGKYEILERIGEGGFGTVWKGKDPFLKRTVAIKTCNTENADLRKRFLREAEIAGGLHHPNVTVVHDFGYHDEVPYLVQEFLSGEDLSAIIRRNDPVPLGTKLRWLMDIARGLEFAHGKGVVHRDVKPSNVRIVEEGTAKVMDFGIAKLAQMDTHQLTKTGTAMGTIGYMAPEQVNGQPVDHRADIFAYGVLAYELLTYERPFDADTMSRIFYRILHEDPRPLTALVPGVSVDLERVVLRCLAKDADHRYGAFRTVLGDLESVAAGRPLEEVPSGEATVIDNPALRPTAMVDAMGRPTGAVAAVARPPRPTTSAPAPPSATTYAAPAARKLPTALLIAAGVGAVVVASAILLLRDPGAPATTTPAAGAPAVLPAAAPAAAPPVAAPAASAPAGPSEADRARAATLLDEARRLVRENRRAAAVDVALDALNLDPSLDAARSLVEQLAQTSAPAAAPVAAPVPAASRPTTVTTSPASVEPPPAPITNPVPVAPAPAAAAPVVAAPAPAPAAPAVDRAAEDEAAVRRALAQYENAYERLDASAVAAVWPGLGATRAAQLQQAFSNYRWLEMNLEGCVVKVAGDQATADCRLRQTFELKVGKGEPRDAPTRFRLSRSGSGWRIDDVGGQ